MWDWMDCIGIIVFDAAFATAVFLTFIVLAMLACRQPARRILLARVALLASLAIIPLVAWGRLPRLYVIDTFVDSRFFPKALFLAAAALDPDDATTESPVATVAPGRFVPAWLFERAVQARRWLPRGLTLVDLAGVGVGSAWLVLGLAGVHWLIYRSRPPSPTTRAVFDGLVARQSRSARRAGLRVCSRLRHPVVTGLFRPMILIPDALDQPEQDPEPLRLSLLHELAHVERSDHWFSTAASLAQSIWFFLPHVWWIRSQLLIDQEFLADLSAAERYGTSSAYASSLLSLAAPETPSRPDVAGRDPRRDAPRTGTIGVQSALFQRMMMLLHCPFPVESRTPRVWSWTSRLGVILASIAAACIVIRWPQSSLALPAPTVAAAPHARFHAPHFLTEPIVDVGGHLRSRVYVLPFTLPPRFDLDVDVRCGAGSLPRIRVVGRFLGIPDELDDADIAQSPTSIPTPGGGLDWHHVHIRRDYHRITVAVDGETIPESTRGDSISDWLTVEPPSDAPAEFRDLIVTW
jgi:beta-lactamase regulating signal transducer with metallopeptidase domain